MKKQQGTAIVVALFVLALVAAAAIAMIDNLRINLRRTELLLNDAQANLFLQGSVAWAINQLITDWKQQQPNAVIDRTPIQSTANEASGAIINSTILDAQGYFNINNITDAQYQMIFAKLVHITCPELNQDAIKNLLAATLDWINPAVNNTVFDQAYAKRNPAYLSAHNAMRSVSEFRLVQGVTPVIFTALSPYLIALPEVTKINVNNADAAL